jgi:hypothetical protein
MNERYKFRDSVVQLQKLFVEKDNEPARND